MNDALWPPAKTNASGKTAAACLGQIDHLGYVGQIIARDGDRVGTPFVELPAIVFGRLDLQVQEPHVVPRPARGRGDQLDAQRLQPQEDLGVHERAGMNGEDLHGRKAVRSQGSLANSWLSL